MLTRTRATPAVGAVNRSITATSAQRLLPWAAAAWHAIFAAAFRCFNMANYAFQTFHPDALFVRAWTRKRIIRFPYGAAFAPLALMVHAGFLCGVFARVS